MEDIYEKKNIISWVDVVVHIRFAAKSDDDISNIIGNYYSNGSMSLENKEIASNTSSAKADVRERIIDFAKTKIRITVCMGATDLTRSTVQDL